jgi:hypothetical protein
MYGIIMSFRISPDPLSFELLKENIIFGLVFIVIGQLLGGILAMIPVVFFNYIFQNLTFNE